MHTRASTRPDTGNVKPLNGSDKMTIKLMTKFCSVAAMALLIFAALGPAKWQLRTGLGFSDRALPRLFRGHVDCLPRLAPAVCGRRSLHGCLSAAGGPAIFYTGSHR